MRIGVLYLGLFPYPQVVGKMTLERRKVSRENPNKYCQGDPQKIGQVSYVSESQSESWKMLTLVTSSWRSNFRRSLPTSSMCTEINGESPQTKSDPKTGILKMRFQQDVQKTFEKFRILPFQRDLTVVWHVSWWLKGTKFFPGRARWSICSTEALGTSKPTWFLKGFKPEAWQFWLLFFDVFTRSFWPKNESGAGRGVAATGGAEDFARHQPGAQGHLEDLRRGKKVFPFSWPFFWKNPGSQGCSKNNNFFWRCL